MNAHTVTFREARLDDIGAMATVRNSVKENVLSDPGRVTEQDYISYLSRSGRGWVAVVNGAVAGFSIADLEGHNIWALFVRPDCEGAGIGRGLHQLMLDWYFTQTKETVWLGTAPGTRAERFYRQAGWTETGLHGKDEIKFEMTYADWQRHRALRPEPS